MNPFGRFIVCAACITALAAGFSCAVKGFELVASAEPAAGGAGGAGGKSAGGGSCESVEAPEAPLRSDPGVDKLDIVVAARWVDIGETALDDGPQVGIDLDLRCTCREAGPSCTSPESDTFDHCDGPGGRDNEAAALFELAAPIEANFTSAGFSAQMDEGDWTLLFRIADYNGQLNDAQVALALYSSPGVNASSCGGQNTLARWDGTDVWPIRSSSVAELTAGAGGSGGVGGSTAGNASGGSGGAGGCGPTGPVDFDINDAKFVDTKAYVVDGVVVAHLPASEFVFSSKSEPVPVSLVGSVVLGRLSQDQGGAWRIDEGLIAARWPADNMLRAMINFANHDQLVCTDSPLFTVIKTAVCDARDIATGVVGVTAPCDAVSFAMAFRAESAMLGALFKDSAIVSPCPSETDWLDASCDR